VLYLTVFTGALPLEKMLGDMLEKNAKGTAKQVIKAELFTRKTTTNHQTKTLTP